ncbi:MAG: RidA family protein [Thermoguttaceae bacterium]|jgi:enamine deaminase RidA (YjgF/YER057c/UK114 family)|nr:RidA family protein [Thermoguttaceae bacterium]
MRPEARLSQLGLQLPPVSKPKGLYRPVLVLGNLAHTSGHLPVRPDGTLVSGRVGVELDQEAAAAAARLAGLCILASLRAELGSLDRVRRVVKVFGMVQCDADFRAQPAVINGASELLAEVFGAECGIGVRSAVGVAALPLGAAVEIEAVFEIDA